MPVIISMLTVIRRRRYNARVWWLVNNVILVLLSLEWKSVTYIAISGLTRMCLVLACIVSIELRQRVQERRGGRWVLIRIQVYIQIYPRSIDQVIWISQVWNRLLVPFMMWNIGLRYVLGVEHVLNMLWRRLLLFWVDRGRSLVSWRSHACRCCMVQI